MFLKKFILSFFFVSLVVSCSSEDSDDIAPSYQYTNEINISAINIGETSATISVLNYNISDDDLIRVEYKKLGDAGYMVTDSFLIQNLNRGVSYTARIIVQDHNKEVYSRSINFITNGFNTNFLSSFYAQAITYNLKYKILTFDEQANLLSSPNIEVLIIVDNQIFEAVNVNILNDRELTFEIPNNIDFFDPNAEDYMFEKTFQIKLKVQDYQTEALQPISYQYSNLIAYNKKPLIRYIHFDYKAFCADTGSQDPSYDALEFYGLFWNYPEIHNDPVDEYSPRYPDEINVRITNVSDPSITKTYFLIDHIYGPRCQEGEEEKVSFLKDLSYISNPIHYINILRITYPENLFPSGEYTIEFNVTNDGKDYLSNKFTFEIKTETTVYNPPIDNN